MSVDDVLGEGCHDGGERGADHHRDGKIEDVAPQQKVLETLQHGAFPFGLTA